MHQMKSYKTMSNHINTTKNQTNLIKHMQTYIQLGGLEHFDDFLFSWEFHRPNMTNSYFSG